MIAEKIQKLIDECNEFQAKLMEVVGRPSSHIVGRIKALEDCLAIVRANVCPHDRVIDQPERQGKTGADWHEFFDAFARRKS